MRIKKNGVTINLSEADIKILSKSLLNEKYGKGCADKPSGCVRKRGNKWIILNNIHGGVWTEGGKFDTKEEANEKLKAMHS